MSIGFTFTGKVKKPETLVETAKRLAEERAYGLSGWDPLKENALNISLCPLDGLLRMAWRKDSGLFAQWTVEGCCYSTPAGPGLHKAAVEALDALGLQKLTVEDETEYFQHRDFDRMLQEHFHPWLKTLVEVSWQRRDEIVNACLCWDMNQYRPEDIPGTVITPVGRFSLEWLKRTLEQQGVEALAERFFLWYHPGKRDALYNRQVALNLLWEHCYYAPSSRSQEDASNNEIVCKNLEMAAMLDREVLLPRRAYEEICALAGRVPTLPDGPALEEEFQPGYRKGLVTYSIGPLRLVVPGLYRYEREVWDEQSGCDKWWDEASLSPIWRVNGYQKREGTAAFTPVLDDDNDLTEWEIRGGAVRCGWRELEEDGQTLYQVRAEVVTGPSLFVITVTCLEPTDRVDILELIRKITVDTQDVQKQTIQANE